MSNIIFADGIGSFAIIDGIARIELVSMTQGTDEKPSRQSSAILAMSLPGFVRAFQDMEKIINKLVADGVLQRGQPQTSAAEGAVSDPPQN